MQEEKLKLIWISLETGNYYNCCTKQGILIEVVNNKYIESEIKQKMQRQQMHIPF